MEERGTWRRRLAARSPALKSGGTLVLAVAAAAVFATVVHRSLPLDGWVFRDFAKIIGWQLLLCAGCLSVGHLVVTKVVHLTVAPLERLVLSMAAGVVCFVFGMYLGGALGLYGPLFAVLLPCSLLAAGLPAALPVLKQAREQRDESLRTGGVWVALASGFGVIGAGLLYLQCMTPESLSYDSTWTHLTIADDYAREGRIVPFVADVAKNLPHLSSILYTWSFLVPGFDDQPLRWMMAQHTELQLFLWTVVSVVPATRWMLGSEGANASWAAFFLFPGFYVYDANLGAGTDHVAAFWALPMLLATVRAAERLSPRAAAFAGLLGGAALHTKYQCFYLVAPLGLVLLGRSAAVLVRSRRSDDAAAEPPRRNTWLAPVAFGLAAVLAISPHFLRNWIYYSNPVYPLMQGLFRGSTPTLPDALEQMEYLFGSASSGEKDFWPRLVSSLRLSFTFSFDPQYSFFGTTPVFGSLFTLLTPITLLQWRRPALRTGFLLAQTALLLWAFTYRVDRNLQLILPWLVAVTAATLAVAWGNGAGSWLARLGLVPLVGLQVIWGGALMLAGGPDRMRSALDLVRTGLTADKGKAKDRYAGYRQSFRRLGDALPADATLLLHTAHLRLGINRRTLSDWAGWQYVIDYRTMRTERDVYDRFAQLGITHMTWNNHDYPHSKQEDVLFVAFTRKYAVPMSNSSGFSLWAMPAEPPPQGPPLEVVSLGIGGYVDGLYSIEKLGVFDAYPAHKRRYQPPDVPITDDELVEGCLLRADALLTESAAAMAKKAPAFDCYTRQIKYYAGYSVYLRKDDPSCAKPVP